MQNLIPSIFPLFILLGIFFFLIKSEKQPVVIFSFALVLLVLTGYIKVESIAHNATNKGVLILVMLLLSSQVIEKTLILSRLGQRIISPGLTATYWKLTGFSAFFSAFLSNTAVVASLVSIVKKNPYHPPTLLLLPLSYAAIAGGTLTLIGTSTNLIVNSLVIDAGHPSLEFWDFLYFGLPITLTVLLVGFFTLKRLPSRMNQPDNVQDYLIEAKVMPGSSLIGKSISENKLRQLEELFLVEIVRQKHLLSPVSPDEIIQKEDILVFSGAVANVGLLKQFPGLTLFATSNGFLGKNLQEVIIANRSQLIGKTLKEARFRSEFNAAVIGIKREGEQLSGKLGRIKLYSGDRLILAAGTEFKHRKNIDKNFFLINSDVEIQHHLSLWQERLSVLGFFAAIALSVVFDIDLLACLFVYLFALFSLGVISGAELKRRFPFEIWLLVISALSLAQVLQENELLLIGLHGLHQLQFLQPALMFPIILFVLTLVLTEFITNNAAAALVFPIAWSLIQAFNLEPYPIIMAVAFGASASFINPYGYQTNLIVLNAGGYKVKEFVRFGSVISIAYAIVFILTMLVRQTIQ